MAGIQTTYLMVHVNAVTYPIDHKHLYMNNEW